MTVLLISINALAVNESDALLNSCKMSFQPELWAPSPQLHKQSHSCHLSKWRNRSLTRHSPRDAKYTSESFRGAQGFRFVWEEPSDPLPWLPPLAYESMKESVKASLASFWSGCGRHEQISAQRSSLDLVTTESTLSIILIMKSWGGGNKMMNTKQKTLSPRPPPIYPPLPKSRHQMF